MRVGTICRPLMAASALLLAGAAPPADRGEAFSTREEIAGLFKRLGVRYLPEQEVADRRIDEVPAEESLKFTGWEVVHRRRIKKYAEGIRSHRLAPVYVKRVNDIVGYGLYAADTIETGSMIGEYAGVAKAAEDVPDTSYSWSYTLRRAGSAEKMKVIVDALKAGNEMRFVNHSETANVEPRWVAVNGRWRMVFVALWTIKANEQILVNYGAAYWKARGITPMKLEP